jgi:hypothetical protein
MADSAPPRTGSRGDRLADLAVFAWGCCFVTIAAVFAVIYPFGHAFDEIEHYSMIVALWQHPTAFVDHASLRVLDLDLGAWSERPNYLAHPPLYHLLMGPIAALMPGDVRIVRLVDVAMVAIGLVLALRAGARHLPRAGDRLAFGFLVFGLSTVDGVAALVNNDDLLILEFGVLFALLAADRRRPIAVGLVLAAIGWTKLNGFVAALLVLGLDRLFAAGRDRNLSPRLADLPLALGAGIGLVPMVATWIRWGRPVWTPPEFPAWFDRIRPDLAATTGPLDFARWFFATIGEKLAARPENIDVTFAAGLIVLVGAACLAGRAHPEPRIRDLARASWLAFLVYALIHVAYAHQSMRTTGSMVEAQPRYYGAPWIFFAFAVAVGLAALPPLLARAARVVIVGFVLVASIPSSMIQMAFFKESLIPADGRDLRPGDRLLAPAVPHPPQRAPAPGGAITP